MQSLPNKFILSIKPKEYLHQGPSHCGVYSVKGILSAYGLDIKAHPKEYHPHIFGRLTGFTFGKNYLPTILKRNGISAERKSADKLSPPLRIDLLKSQLSKDKPVMIRIGNGYISDTYNSLVGKLMSHWITLWGYDDNRRLFFIYDSGLPQKYWGITLPIGNTTRTYKEIIRDWNMGRWQFWYWPFFGSRNTQTYIEIYGRN